MLEYLPWSETTYINSLTKYSSGILSTLDVELGGDCNYQCVYCDSPDREKICSVSLEGLEILMSTGSFEWVYVCGLGEPTFNKNYAKFITLLDYCKKYDVRCSTFSNLSQLTPDLINYVQDGILHLFFKYDSHDAKMLQTLYGTRDNIEKQLSNIKKAKKLVHAEKGTTNLAASIVLTRLNKNYIVPIVEECLSAQIYPLLGELELSGKGQANYENLYLNKDELLEIKDAIERLLNDTYNIPVCPSGISGIHLSYDGYITVDQFSGLSCHWFWLEEPKIKRLMKFSGEVTLDDMTETILNYRDKCLSNINDFLSQNEEVGFVFGGCGGNVHHLFRQYLNFHRRRIV